MHKPLAALASLALLSPLVSPAFGATKTVNGTSQNTWSPKSLKVAKGDKIKFVWNNTGKPHDVKKVSGSGGKLTANKLSHKGSATFTVPSNAKSGKKWTFVCSIHKATMGFTATVR